VAQNFKRKTFVYKNYFWEFYNNQTIQVQDKIDWIIELVRTLEIVPAKYFSHMTGTDGIFEMRIKSGSNIYRIFCCFDEGRLIILFNGFQKKTQKTPLQEIEKAKRIQKEYYADKRENKLDFLG